MPPELMRFLESMRTRGRAGESRQRSGMYKELKALEETQQQAIDTIMMDGSKVADLTLKLNGILGKSGMQLLVEGVQA